MPSVQIQATLNSSIKAYLNFGGIMLAVNGFPDCLGKKCWITAIDGERTHAIIEDVIFLGQGPKPFKKLICLQKLRFPDKHLEYRFTYYMVGFKDGHKDHWVFGQYSLMIPAKDLKKLLAAAKKKEWDGF